MKKLTLCILLVLGISLAAWGAWSMSQTPETTLAEQAEQLSLEEMMDTQIANSCSNQEPYGAGSVSECIDLCASKGCGFGRYESSTNCCFCGDLW